MTRKSYIMSSLFAHYLIFIFNFCVPFNSANFPFALQQAIKIF